MRGGQRLREKIEITLDDRQIAALAVGALILLGGVFALGLLVGKQLARNAPPQSPAIGDLAALDAQREEAQRPPPAKPARRDEIADDRVPETGRPPVETPAHTAPERVIPRAAEKPKEVPAPPAEAGGFTVQLGAWQDRADALRLAGRASAAGLKPFVVEARLPGKGVWYRVRVGAFPDKDAAERYRRDVERELRAAAVVMPSR